VVFIEQYSVTFNTVRPTKSQQEEFIEIAKAEPKRYRAFLPKGIIGNDVEQVCATPALDPIIGE
jgi:hypothetical protein